MEKDKLVSIILVSVLVVSALFSFGYFAMHPSHAAVKGDLDLGPRVNYHIYDDPITDMTNISRELSVINNTTINVQIFGSYPDSNETYVLANTSLDFFNGSIFLSPQFYNVSNAWSSFISSHHLNMYPSLTIEAYENIYENGSVYIYSYYNNIPFDPYAIKIVSMASSNLTSAIKDRSVQASIALNVFNGTGINVGNYSNITFTPYVVNVSLSFSKKPIQVINASVFTNVDVQSRADPYCEEYQFDYYTYSYDTYDKVTATHNLTGPFPIMIVHMSKNVADGKSMIIMSGAYTIINGIVGLESDQAYKPNSGDVTTTMSSDPSYIHNANLSVSTESVGYGVIPLDMSLNNGYNVSQANNRTTGIVAITNASYAIKDFNQYTSEYRTKWHEIVYYEEIDGKVAICHVYRENEGTSYVGTTYDGEGFSLAISYIQTTINNQLNLVAELIPNQIAYGISYLMHSDAIYKHLDLNTTGNSSSLHSSSVEYDLSGYVDASDAVKEAHNALTTFSAALGVGIATIELLNALNILDFDAGEAATALLAAELIDKVADLGSAILGDISSMGFVSDTEIASIAYSITNEALINPGSSYGISVMLTGQPMILNMNGNSYFFYAPEDYLNATSIIP
ncbi:hypothetical protein [Thermoplasma sp.]|uniref:hypothetical protein n=1 Tax=Thermoplasma sp. TaxID=1973142 RepID=UPI001284E7A1|nr:hypothetical protein [Thermoplasma sp.]KAA8922403.1 MAG: hypothetical protein F6Q11_04725 [Thermoplasma sp.]